MTDTVDWEDIVDAAAPTDQQTTRIADLVKRAQGLENNVAFLEGALNDAKRDLQNMLTKELPDAMTEAGTSMFRTDDGLHVELESICAGSLPKDPERRSKALTWLRAHGGEALIKNELVAEFDKKKDNLVGRVEETLDELGIKHYRSTDVHHSTLKAFARERLKRGEEVELELLGLWAGRKAKIEQAS